MASNICACKYCSKKRESNHLSLIFHGITFVGFHITILRNLTSPATVKTRGGQRLSILWQVTLLLRTQIYSIYWTEVQYVMQHSSYTCTSATPIILNRLDTIETKHSTLLALRPWLKHSLTPKIAYLRHFPSNVYAMLHLFTKNTPTALQNLWPLPPLVTRAMDTPEQSHLQITHYLD